MRGAASPAWSNARLHVPSLLPVRTGMPELCRAGLSETWLLKASGHRHWLALAEAHGLAVPGFHASDGARLYPAFTYVVIAKARLESVTENALLDFAVTLRRTGRTRFRSEIAVACDGIAIALVTMETVFVRRGADGSNHSARSAVVAGPCRLLPQARDRLTLPAAPGPILATALLDPSPHEDFNGVGFLYFAAFQALVDRAEWQWFRRADAVVTRERRLEFFANAEVGERITATLHFDRQEDGEHSHVIALSRESDGVPIARALTRRWIMNA